MPNVPEMSVMWGPTESLLAAVNKSGQDIKEAAQEYQKQAETAIKDMQ
jgi:arabinogalactan oligomer/maltooligosaccharide transport system substrate-binding protein